MLILDQFYFDILITVLLPNVNHKWFLSIAYLAWFHAWFLVFIDLPFQPQVFWKYSIISKSAKYVTLLDIIVTYIKGNITTKIRKLFRPPRNLEVGNKLHYFWNNLFAWEIYCLDTKYSLKDLKKSKFRRKLAELLHIKKSVI